MIEGWVFVKMYCEQIEKKVLPVLKKFTFDHFQIEHPV